MNYTMFMLKMRLGNSPDMEGNGVSTEAAVEEAEDSEDLTESKDFFPWPAMEAGCNHASRGICKSCCILLSLRVMKI